MTREEQRAKAAHEYIQSDSVSTGNEVLAFGDFINGAKWADANPQWIPVEEELPKADGRYIIANKYGGVEQMNFDAESKYWWLRGTGKMSDFVTDWMPMPKPPKKEE